MSNINSVILTGYTTRDSELRTTQSGLNILNFSVAVNDRVKNQATGEWEDYHNFINCTMFGKRAEALAQYLTKGTRVAINGKLHYSSWEQDGNKRSKLDVTVDNLELLSSRQEREQAQEQTQTNAETGLYSEDVPF